MAMGYRREATSHEVRNNRNPTQVPEAARRVGADASLSHSARSAPLKTVAILQVLSHIPPPKGGGI